MSELIWESCLSSFHSAMLWITQKKQGGFFMGAAVLIAGLALYVPMSMVFVLCEK